jgi:uncharacterized protein YeaO (DUF488 family)
MRFVVVGSQTLLDKEMAPLIVLLEGYCMLQQSMHSRRSGPSGKEANGAWVASVLRYATAETLLPVRHTHLAPEMARRLRTGCLGEELYEDTYTILVMRQWPHHLPAGSVNAWWPILAPLPRLLHAPRRERDNKGTSWEQFAARYRADLDALPLPVQNTYLLHLAQLLQRHPTVTLLSLEPSCGLPEAEVHAQRRVLWRWLME